MLNAAYKRNYQEYLPEIFQTEDENEFLPKFLDAFKEVLTQNTQNYCSDKTLPDEGIEELIDRVHEFFNPHTAPGAEWADVNRNFVDWLAGWLSFAQKAHFNDTALRRIIPQLVPLYAKRGTPEGFIGYLELFAGKGNVSIYETFDEKKALASILSSAVNEQFLCNNNFTFGVRIDLTEAVFSFEDSPLIKGESNDEEVKYYANLFRAVVAREKPAHTDVVLYLVVNSGIQIAVTSTIGSDTTIGYGTQQVATTASINLT